MNRRSLEPLRYGPHQCARRREYVWMALALALLLWYEVGGDRPEDRILYSSTMAAGQDRATTTTFRLSQKVAEGIEPAPAPAAPMLCPKLNDSPYGHLWLRWQIEHRRETGFNWHRCAYGEIWRDVVNEWRTM